MAAMLRLVIAERNLGAFEVFTGEKGERKDSWGRL
jgi:hypothetical protein